MKSVFSFERKLNLLIGIPSGDMWVRHFGMSLCNMMGHLMDTPVPGFREQRMQPYVTAGSILSRGRAKCVQEAKRQGCTHLLFTDTDQSFPRDTAHRLLQHGKDVVACNIATKQIPASPTARRRAERLGGEPVYTDLDSPPLEEVWRVGTGVMLLDMRVFQKIGPDAFPILWKEELEDYQGEDWALCDALHAAGFKIWIDHRLSDEVKHWGLYGYDHNVVGRKELVEVSDKRIGEA